MSPARKRGVLIGAALAVVAVVVAAVVLLVREDQAPATGGAGESTEAAQDSPAQVAARFLRQFEAGDLNTAPVDDKPAATAALAEARGALSPVSVKATLGEVPTTPGDATTTSATFHASWTFAGSSVWKYEGKLDLVRNAGNWVIRWAMSVIHPKLEAGQRLSVAPVSAKPVVADRDGKALVGGDAAGVAPILQGALSKVASEQNGGSGTQTTVTVSRVDASGKPVETLFGQAKESGQPLVSTLSVASQSAAQKAVDGFQGSAIIVAMKTSGDLLAVAQNAAAGNQPMALRGQYAPGSAFKIATATAALQQGGVSADSPVACPGSEQIRTRTLKNENGFDLGTVSLKTAFAASCNTTFGRLAGQLPADGLAKAASQLGLNADFEIPGLATETGKVEPSSSADEQVEAGIGQGKVQVSPLGAALMAATVATGKPVVPKLWQGLETTVNAGYQAPPAGVLNQVRAMMREVCTTGTAKALKGSGNVFGKTGTAQFGSGADANGWFVGYRGDVAFAVMLEGSNDSEPAVRLAAKFLAG